MDKIVEKVAELSYELFGILIPGMVGALLLKLYHVALFDGASFDGWFEFKFSSEKLLVEVFLLVLIYLIGQLLNQVAETTFKPTRKDDSCVLIIGRFLIFWPFLPKELRSYNVESSFNRAKETLETKLNIKTADDTWGSFYGVASTLIYSYGLRSRLSTYQNKYTMHRSLAFLMALNAKIALLTLVFLFFKNDFIFDGVTKAILFVTFSSLFLSYLFTQAFIRFWLLWGDRLCWEIITFPKSAESKES